MPNIIKKGTNIILIVFSIVAVLLTFRSIALPHDAFNSFYTHYNNYVIFKQSFFHLIHKQDLYISYPGEQFDLFKYSPTFALFFGCLATLPDWLGLALWNLLNVLVLFFAIRSLPRFSELAKITFCLFILQELVTTTMNSQSNALIAGLLVLAWVALEKGHWKRAILFIGLTAFIKIFGILFFALFLLYPRWWRAIIPGVIIFAILFLLPLPVLGWNGLMAQYKSYGHLLANDSNTFVKYSVMGWLQSWFGFIPPKNIVVLIGLILQLMPLAIHQFTKSTNQQIDKSTNQQIHKALFTSSLLIWLVIFNHMAESPTFIIAVTGVLIWFFYTQMPKWWKIGILTFVIVFTCFGPSDIFPHDLRYKIVADWQLKVFPCILVWVVCLGEMIISGMNQFQKQRIDNGS